MTRRAALLLLLSAAVPAGADETVAPPDGYRLDDYNAPVPDAVPGGTVVHTEALRALLAAQRVILVDVLPAQRRPDGMKPSTPWIPMAHRNLPGSLWLPDVGRGDIPVRVDKWFERSLLNASTGNRAQAVVLYCRADCWMSWNAAKRAIQHGWTHVYWYPDGPDAWEAAGLPLAEAEPLPMP